MLHSRAVRRLIRAAAALLAVVVGLVGLPRPASAVEPRIGLFGYLEAGAVATGSTGKETPVRFGAYTVGGATMPATVTMKVDFTPAAGVVTAKLARPVQGCSATEAVFTCTKNTNAAPDIENGDFALVLAAGSTAQVGNVAKVKVTLSAPGATNSESTYEIRITEPGPDLRARDFELKSTPGGTVSFRPQYRNQGARPAQTIVLYLGVDRFASVTDRFSNCRYSPDPQSVAAVCVFKNVDLEPGASMSTKTELKAKLTADVPGRTFVYYHAEVFSNGTTINGPWDAWPAGTGSALEWQRDQAVTANDTTSDVDPIDNQGSVLITTPANPSDVVANGATTKGKVGDTEPVKVGLTNKGPGYIYGVSDSETSDPENAYNAAFVVTFPAGVQVTGLQVPAGDGNYCHGIVDGKVDTTANQTGRSKYRCMRWAMAVNETYTVTFTVKITGAVSTAGSVVARGGSSDPATANNTAEVKFTGEDGLPITGPNAALTAAVGILMIVAGFALYYAGRKPAEAPAPAPA